MALEKVAPVERCAIAGAEYKVIRLAVFRVLPGGFQALPHGGIQGNLPVTGIGFGIVEFSFIEPLLNLDTWSPDGKFLVYGNVFCQASHSCAIHRIDLSTGKVNTLPGSEGLMTARWSPDGRYVSAMQPERHELLLFDVRSAKWRKLANSMTGADLSWSPDSRFLYSDIPGANARIVRVSAATRAMETVLDLRLMDRFILGTAHDAVFCLAPNGNLLFPWPSAITEIYSFRLQN